MKRFLGVLIASMFLASAAIAADDMKKGDVEKKADTEGKGGSPRMPRVKKAKGKNGEKTKATRAKRPRAKRHGRKDQVRSLTHGTGRWPSPPSSIT